jgi:hypothetical protein
MAAQVTNNSSEGNFDFIVAPWERWGFGSRAGARTIKMFALCGVNQLSGKYFRASKISLYEEPL